MGEMASVEGGLPSFRAVGTPAPRGRGEGDYKPYPCPDISRYAIVRGRKGISYGYNLGRVTTRNISVEVRRENLPLWDFEFGYTVQRI